MIQTAFLGDTALALYLPQKIKNIFAKNGKTCKIIFVTLPAWGELVKNAKCIDEVVFYDKKGKHKSIFSAFEIAKTINSHKPDCIISPHKSFRTSLLVSLLRANTKIGFDKASLKFVYNHLVKYDKSIHEINRDFSLLTAFDDDFIAYEIKSINEVDFDLADNLLKIKRPYICIAPGSVWATKKWRTDYYAELINLIIKNKKNNYNFVITGGKNDIETSNELMNFLKDKLNEEIFSNRIINLTGKTNLIETQSILKGANLVITNDSAPTHLAELVNTNVLTIYGPTSPKFGFAPRLENSSFIELEGLSCKPCHIHGKNICPINTHECMNNLLPQKVFDKVEKMLIVIKN